MGEISFGMFADICLNLLPVALVITDILAGSADRQQAAEFFDFSQGGLEFIN